jgi:uncharacterized protein (TIGR02217 family)
VFPLDAGIWSDGGNWATGNWIAGKGPAVTPPLADPQPSSSAYFAFPVLAGQGWSVSYAPRFTTRVQAHVSRRDSRAARMSAPLYDIDLSFDLLRGDPASAELQEVIAFIGEHLGQAQPFMFSPPGGLGSFAGAPLGVGDGVSTRFVVTRAIGGFVENVQALVGAPNVYLNGVLLAPSAYSVSILPACVTFLVAPAARAVLTADFAAAHLARFADDGADLEEFMANFWSLRQLKIETVRA